MATTTSFFRVGLPGYHDMVHQGWSDWLQRHRLSGLVCLAAIPSSFGVGLPDCHDIVFQGWSGWLPRHRLSGLVCLAATTSFFRVGLTGCHDIVLQGWSAWLSRHRPSELVWLTAMNPQMSHVPEIICCKLWFGVGGRSRKLPELCSLIRGLLTPFQC